MRCKFSPGDRIWGRNTGWDGVQYRVEATCLDSASGDGPEYKIQARSMSSGRLVTFSESQMVRCLEADVKVGAWEQRQALAVA